MHRADMRLRPGEELPRMEAGGVGGGARLLLVAERADLDRPVAAERGVAQRRQRVGIGARDQVEPAGGTRRGGHRRLHRRGGQGGHLHRLARVVGPVLRVGGQRHRRALRARRPPRAGRDVHRQLQHRVLRRLRRPQRRDADHRGADIGDVAPRLGRAASGGASGSRRAAAARHCRRRGSRASRRCRTARAYRRRPP